MSAIHLCLGRKKKRFLKLHPPFKQLKHKVLLHHQFSDHFYILTLKSHFTGIFNMKVFIMCMSIRIRYKILPPQKAGTNFLANEIGGHAL